MTRQQFEKEIINEFTVMVVLGEVLILSIAIKDMIL